MALVSPCLSAEPPQGVDWKSMMTVAPVKRDPLGVWLEEMKLPPVE